MALFCLCALAGAYALQLCSELPGSDMLAVLAVMSLVACLIARVRPVGAFLSGFVVLAIASHAVIDDRLDPGFAGKTIKVSARVSDFPKDNGVSLSFRVRTLRRDDD